MNAKTENNRCKKRGIADLQFYQAYQTHNTRLWKQIMNLFNRNKTPISIVQ